MHKEIAFTKVITEYEGVIFKITTIYSNTADDQKDLFQEIVYQLWKSFDSFRNESKISTVIYRVALNTAITNFKKEKRKVNSIPIDKVMLQYIEQHDSVMEERITQLYAAIKKLGAIEKGIILLFLEGKSYEEIAAITGLTNTGVGTRLTRIRQKLKSQIVNT